MSTPAADPAPARRNGHHTRREAQRVALELFTAHGYEATSLREIAEELGINKASLYYHFASKEDILLSLIEDRGTEAQELVEWISDQPRSPGLLEAAVLRWVSSFSTEKLRGIRFMIANPLVTRTLTTTRGAQIGTNLSQVVDALTSLLDRPSPTEPLLLRMAILSINSAVEAAAGTDTPDEDILRAANLAARALVAQLPTSARDS